MSEPKDEQLKFDYSFEFQRKILAFLVRDLQFLTMYGYDIVQPRYFDSFYHQFICKSIIRFFRKYGRTPDKEGLEAILVDSGKTSRMDDEAIQNILDEVYQMYTMDLENMDFIGDKLLKFIRRQNLTRGLNQIGELLDSDEDLDSAVSIMQKAVTVGHSVDLGLNVGNDYTKLKGLYQKEYGLQNIIKSPIEDLNRALGGGFYKKFLYVVTAPPGRGKTTFMAWLAAYMMRKGFGVYYYTFEVPEIEILFKVVSSITGITHDTLLDSSEEQFKEYLSRMAPFAKQMQIKKYAGKSISVHGLRSHASRAKTVEGVTPGIIFVDYADYLLSTLGTKDNSYFEGGDVYQDLLNLAEEYNCPVITASQPKVDAWSKHTIEEGDLAESSKKAQLARGIISMNQTQEEHDNNYMRLYTAKMSKGMANKTIKVQVDLAKSHFAETRKVQ